MKFKEPNVIYFKSIPKYWHKECLGLKRNTVRKQDDENDHRFKLLKQWMSAKIDELTIIIQDSKTGEVFSRKVTDVSFFEGLYIISW